MKENKESESIQDWKHRKCKQKNKRQSSNPKASQVRDFANQCVLRNRLVAAEQYHWAPGSLQMSEFGLSPALRNQPKALVQWGGASVPGL